MSVLTRILVVCLLPLLAACTATPAHQNPPPTEIPDNPTATSRPPTPRPLPPTESAPATIQPATAEAISPTAEKQTAENCPLTEAAWVMPPEDSAVLNKPAEAYYYVNDDDTIWASAWWVDQPEYPLRSGEEGNKLGWFRPAGATLTITGERLDGKAAPLEAHVPCCYPTRFQATGLMFPTEGCWRVTATAEDRELSFVVRVEPGQ